MNNPKVGDSVSWESSGGHSEGKVVKKITSRTKIKNHTIAAKKDDPEFLVTSKKSGKVAAHKPESLDKHSYTN